MHLPAELRQVSFAAPVNKTLFWGGLPPGNANVLETLNVFSDAEVTLEFTHGGSLLNGLCFCGSSDTAAHPDGFNYESCPYQGTMYSYWVGVATDASLPGLR